MKKERGITLVSLVMYVVVLTVVIELVMLFNGDFYPKIASLNEENILAENFDKFNLSFLKDVKESATASIVQKNSDIVIALSNGAHYYYVEQDGAIYREKIKIVDNINSFSVNYYSLSNKNILRVGIIFGENENKQFGRTINYILNYWM